MVDMEQLLVIIAVVVGAAVALYCVRLLDRAWLKLKQPRAKRQAGTHQEIKLPKHRRS